MAAAGALPVPFAGVARSPLGRIRTVRATADAHGLPGCERAAVAVAAAKGIGEARAVDP
ncbi:hypothetical protein GCM10023235_08630 [Kitasatospora terrestris]|uniref:Uncharacterized protein n=1 Tax=Kitasatospora terrestris TaxID=258051 RepID=A0ABP9DDL2_9ACTN